MSLYFLLLLMAPNGPATANLVTEMKLASPPATQDQFFQNPRVVTWDEKGHVFVLDTQAQTVWHWDEQGRFLNQIGQAGQGPGEFTFSKGNGLHHATLTIVGNDLWVYDDGPHTVKVFSTAGKYKHTINLDFPHGHLQQVMATSKKTLLVLAKKDQQSPDAYTIGFCDDEGQFGQILTELTLPAGPNRTDHFLQGFGYKAVLNYDVGRGTILLGSGETSQFTVFRSKTNTSQVLEFPGKSRPVTKADKAEFKQYESANYDHSHPLEFPEYKPYYNRLLTVGSQDFFAFTISPYHGQLTGTWLNAKGEVKARLKANLGEMGRLEGAGGKLLTITTDEEGNYQLTQVTLALTK